MIATATGNMNSWSKIGSSMSQKTSRAPVIQPNPEPDNKPKNEILLSKDPRGAWNQRTVITAQKQAVAIKDETRPKEKCDTKQSSHQIYKGLKPLPDPEILYIL